jgi:protein-disulfide isomerase
MRSPFFIGTTVLVAMVILILFGISAMAPLEPTKKETGTNADGVAPLERPTVIFGNPYRGPKDAKVTIVEFGDFLCVPCALMNQTLNELLSEFPEDLRVVWKDFPLIDQHKEALNAAVAARCSALQGRFWEYHDILLRNQNSINASGYGIFAEQIGLDLKEFNQCIDEQRTRPIVERDFEEGQRLRIDGVPYLFVNGRRVSGAIEKDSLRALISSEVRLSPNPVSQ